MICKVESRKRRASLSMFVFFIIFYVSLLGGERCKRGGGGQINIQPLACKHVCFIVGRFRMFVQPVDVSKPQHRHVVAGYLISPRLRLPRYRVL